MGDIYISERDHKHYKFENSYSTIIKFKVNVNSLYNKICDIIIRP